MRSSVCIGMHVAFTEQTFSQLLNSGAEDVITCNTIAHNSNGIDVNKMIVQALEVRK